MNAPASIQARTNKASTARTGGSTLLSRRNASTNPVPRSARRCPTQRNLAPTSRLRGLLRGGRLRYDGRRYLTRGGVRPLEVDVGLYLNQELRLHGRVQGRCFAPGLGLLDGTRVLGVDQGVATVCEVGHCHQPGEVTRP